MRDIFRFLIVAIIASICDLASFGENSDNKYISPTPGELPIVATSPYLEWEKPSLNDFEGVKECGFNCVLCSSFLDVKSILTLCQQTNLKAIIAQGNASPEYFMKTVKEYKNSPELGAWALKDEPAYGLWYPDESSIPHNERKYNLVQLYHNVLAEDNNHLVYINLSASKDKSNIGPYKQYIDYLNEFQKVFKPKLWCYDVYPIRSKNGRIIIDYQTFYNHLINFSKISKSTNTPFWAYCLSQGFTMPKINLTRPLPTVGMLRFEAFSALAMGAKGIVYWTYSQREESANTHYLGAPIDTLGQRTKVWDAVKKVNEEIKTLQSIFLSSELKKYAIIGNDSYNQSMKNLASFGPITDIKTQNPGILISNLHNSHSNFLIVVNQNVTSSQTIEFNMKIKCDVIQCTGLYRESDNKTKVSLEPGGYIILEF